MSTVQVEIPLADILPSRAAVLASQGIVAENLAPARILALADQALALLGEQVQARGQWRRVDASTLSRVYEGQGRNAPGPILDVARQALHQVLFVVTLGQRVCDAIAALFAAHDFALASFLDGAASEMADRASTWMEWQAAQALGAEHDPGHLVLAYSPGYCGWHLSGQAALFDQLEPATIGVQLTESFLMSPVKSVSGVLLDGPPAIHRIEARYGFCANCRSRSCVVRRRFIDDPEARKEIHDHDRTDGSRAGDRGR